MGGGPNPPPPDPKNLKDAASMLHSVIESLKADAQILSGIRDYIEKEGSEGHQEKDEHS